MAARREVVQAVAEAGVAVRAAGAAGAGVRVCVRARMRCAAQVGACAVVV